MRIVRATRQATSSVLPLTATAPPMAPTVIARPDASAATAVRWIAANRSLVVGLTIIVVVAVAAWFAPAIAPYAPDEQRYDMRLAPPGSAYPLGDALGRDVFSRLIYAGRVSLAVALPSTAIALVVGVAVGSLAGYYGGWTDRAMMRLTDLTLVFPTFFLMILAVATFGRGVPLLTLIIGLTAWPTNAWVVRAQMLDLRRRDFVTAARAAGAADPWIIWRHLVPQLIPVIVVSATIRVAGNILVESGLRFIGLGVMPPTRPGGTWFPRAPIPCVRRGGSCSFPAARSCWWSSPSISPAKACAISSTHVGEGGERCGAGSTGPSKRSSC
jgi:peptide/nickel transport system permease protein